MANKKEIYLIFLYNILFITVITLGFPIIIPMVLISGKRRKTVLQRLGIAKFPKVFTSGKTCKPERKRIWVHALSVGEVLSAVPLVKRLEESSDSKNIVFSASTRTGFDIANQYLTDVVHSIFYFPYDLPFSVKQLAQRVAPDLVVIVETDIWPNFLFRMEKDQVPVILVNARLSKKSYIGYKRLGFFTKQVFLKFVHICAQSSEDARRFREIGVPSDRITITGNVKFDEAQGISGSQDISKLRHSKHIQDARKILLAGSTHPGEESILLEAFSRIKNQVGDLMLIVAPRNPDRAGSVSRIFETAGFSVILLKELKKTPSIQPLDVIVIDAIGLLKTLYAVADFAFIGGSLVNCGGHNPLEAAAFSKPVLFGEDMSDFESISKMLLDAGGAVRVKDATDLYNVVVSLTENGKKALEMGENAYGVFTANKGAVEKTVKVIKPYL